MGRMDKWDELIKKMTKGISLKEDGTIVLDPNNPYHVAWLDSDEEDEKNNVLN